MANTNGSVVQKKFFREQIQRNMFVFVFWIMFLIGKAVFEVYILVEIVRKIVNSILTGNFILKNAIPEYGGLLLVYVAVFFVGCIFRFYIVSNGNINMENSLLGQILRSELVDFLDQQLIPLYFLITEDHAVFCIKIMSLLFA